MTMQNVLANARSPGTSYTLLGKMTTICRTLLRRNRGPFWAKNLLTSEADPD
jgi:hypothetical protein